MSDTKRAISPKKKMLILIGAVVAVLLLAAVVLLLSLGDQEKPKPKIPPRAEGSFAPIDWNEDITLDQEYMALDRRVRYTNESGFTYTLNDFNYNDGGAAAAFIYKVLGAIRDGDHEAYNAAFSQYYKNAVGEKQPFTPQKLYDISFNIYAVEDGGEAGNLILYQVFYRIKDNNGTFRDDILSDECRRVTFYLRETASGYEIYTVTYRTN